MADGPIHAVKCSCGAEVVTVQGTDGGVELTIWDLYPNTVRRKLYCRVRAAWRVLRCRSLWGDQVILDVDDVDRLCGALRAAWEESDG